MGDGWKAWKVTTVLWQQRKTLQSTSTTRFLTDSINLCVTQFKGFHSVVAYLNAANNARLRRAVRGETKLLPPTSKFNINLSCRERWFRKSRKSWNLGLQSSDQVDRGTGTEDGKFIQENFKLHRTHHISTLGERAIVGAAHIRLLSRPAHAYCTYFPAIEVQHTDKYMTMISPPHDMISPTTSSVVYLIQERTSQEKLVSIVTTMIDPHTLTIINLL